MNAEDMKKRTKQFALRVLKLADSLPRTPSGRTLSGQVVRSGASVAANYRTAGKARSKAEFISMLGIAEEEADETRLWLELIIESRQMPAKKLESLHQEACELTIIAASRISASHNKLATANRKL